MSTTVPGSAPNTKRSPEGLKKRLLLNHCPLTSVWEGFLFCMQESSFINATQDNPPWFIAIDEARCYMDWGTTFRPVYLNLPDLIKTLPERPVILATTASAPETQSKTRQLTRNPRNRNSSGDFVMEAPPGIGPGNRGFAVRCLTAWLWRRIYDIQIGTRKGPDFVNMERPTRLELATSTLARWRSTR